MSVKFAAPTSPGTLRVKTTPLWVDLTNYRSENLYPSNTPMVAAPSIPATLYNTYCSVCTRTPGLEPNSQWMVQIGAADRPRTSNSNSTSSRGSKPIGSADTDLESDVAVGAAFYGPRCIDTCPVFNINFRLQTIECQFQASDNRYRWIVLYLACNTQLLRAAVRGS